MRNATQVSVGFTNSSSASITSIMPLGADRVSVFCSAKDSFGQMNVSAPFVMELQQAQSVSTATLLQVMYQQTSTAGADVRQTVQALSVVTQSLTSSTVTSSSNSSDIAKVTGASLAKIESLLSLTPPSNALNNSVSPPSTAAPSLPPETVSLVLQTIASSTAPPVLPLAQQHSALRSLSALILAPSVSSTQSSSSPVSQTAASSPSAALLVSDPVVKAQIISSAFTAVENVMNSVLLTPSSKAVNSSSSSSPTSPGEGQTSAQVPPEIATTVRNLVDTLISSACGDSSSSAPTSQQFSSSLFSASCQSGSSKPLQTAQGSSVSLGSGSGSDQVTISSVFYPSMDVLPAASGLTNDSNVSNVTRLSAITSVQLSSAVVDQVNLQILLPAPASRTLSEAASPSQPSPSFYCELQHVQTDSSITFEKLDATRTFRDGNSLWMCMSNVTMASSKLISSRQPSSLSPSPSSSTLPSRGSKVYATVYRALVVQSNADLLTRKQTVTLSNSKNSVGAWLVLGLMCMYGLGLLSITLLPANQKENPSKVGLVDFSQIKARVLGSYTKLLYLTFAMFTVQNDWIELFIGSVVGLSAISRFTCTFVGIIFGLTANAFYFVPEITTSVQDNVVRSITCSILTIVLSIFMRYIFMQLPRWSIWRRKFKIPPSLRLIPAYFVSSLVIAGCCYFILAFSTSISPSKVTQWVNNWLKGELYSIFVLQPIVGVGCAIGIFLLRRKLASSTDARSIVQHFLKIDDESVEVLVTFLLGCTSKGRVSSKSSGNRSEDPKVSSKVEPRNKCSISALPLSARDRRDVDQSLMGARIARPGEPSPTSKRTRDIYSSSSSSTMSSSRRSQNATPSRGTSPPSSSDSRTKSSHRSPSEIYRSSTGRSGTSSSARGSQEDKSRAGHPLSSSASPSDSARRSSASSSRRSPDNSSSSKRSKSRQEEGHQRTGIRSTREKL
eukprot:GILI01037045.1.p1 GENE.GILI01037045.1~~GILI01037045.1.p1  ORF type:complete len:955 (+),score=138.57 GILI01037045.1:3-2867(+)